LLLASLSSQAAFLLRAANAAGADAGVRLCEALDAHYFAYPGANDVSLRALMQTDPSGSWCQQELAVQIDSQSGFIATPVPGAVVTERFAKVLYLRPTRLDEQALSETAAALASEPRVRGLVLDLRNVPGGSVAATLEFADLFLSKGQLARSWRRGRVHDHPASPGEVAVGVAIAVLMDGNTRGGAEMLAYTLRVNERAGLFGSRSRGLAVAAQVYRGHGEHVLRLTEAVWLGRDGEPLLDGVSPDVCIAGDGSSLPLGTAVRMGGCQANLPIVTPLGDDAALKATLAFF